MTWSVADTNQSIPERFEDQARRHPDKVAIAGTSWEPTFEELDGAANRLAHAVLDRDPGNGGQAALLLRHDAPLAAAILGALKAGKAAVTLSPSDPPARLDRIRASTGAESVLCDQSNRELALRAGFPPERVISVPDRPGGDSRGPAIAIDPARTAFLVQTSGTTGDPKGVMHTHRSWLDNVLRQTNGLGFRADDRLTLLASPSGAQGLAMLWVALLNGATLCPFPVMERGVTGLAPWLAEHRLTVLVMSPSLFRNFVRTLDGERLSTIRLLRLGAEVASRDDFDAFRRHLPPTSALVNMYASSEAGNVARCLLTPADDPADGPLPVGEPAEGISVRVVDERGEPVRSGRTGEIVVRGEHLSQGYWGDPALTAERFDGAPSDGGACAYRTGDLGCVSEDGSLTLVGRGDLQVNVRGYRVELSEVEGSMARLPGVAAAAVAPRATRRGDVKLAGYVTARPGSTLSMANLRRELRAVLPDHAVPSTFAQLESMPLGPHGKVDRRRLAEIEQPATTGPASSPASEIEELLAAIWARAFELDRVDRNDDFFELGGDSLTAAVIAADLHGAIGIEVELGTFADGPTVARMAQLVDRIQADAGDERPALESVTRVDPPPLSFFQEDIWRSSRTPEESAAHTVVIAYLVEGPLDVAALRRGVDDLVRRHEGLRTTFAQRDGRPVQVVHPEMALELPLIDISDFRDARAEANDLIEREARIPFDLERGPLVRLRLFRIHADEHLLVRVNHHLVSDASAWELLFDELGPVYDARRRGGAPDPTEPAPLQCGEYATWERRSHQPDSRRHRAEVEWWRPLLDPALPGLPLPCTRPSIATEAPPSDGVIWWGLEPEVSERLARLGAEAGATYYMVRLALFAAHLAAETGVDDVALLTALSKRRLPQLQGMFGPCLDMRPLRIRLDPEDTLSQWLRRVRTVVVDASAHSEIPLSALSEELGVGGPPRIQAMFAESRAVDHVRVNDLEVSSLRYVFTSTAPGFSVWVNRRQEADRCYARFDQRVFDPAAVRSFISGYQRLAADAHAHADRPVGELVGRGADSVSRPWRARLSRLLRS